MKDILGALAASIALGAASTATAQVDTSLSVTLDTADPVWSNLYFSSSCSINSSAGDRRFKTIQVTVASSGAYVFSDQINANDGGLGFYSGPFDPLSPGTNCVASIDDSGTATLAAGIYTVVITSYHPNKSGLVTYNINGPAAITVVAPAPVPTLSEWAMILFGAVLAGGAALFIQRRRKSA